MGGFYQPFTSARATEPDPALLFAQMRTLDPTAGIQHSAGSSAYILKKATAWTGPQITAAQNVLDTAPAVTPQSLAQAEIDAWSITTRALVLALIDQLNVLRADMTTLGINRPAITAPAALAAVRAKAATLT